MGHATGTAKPVRIVIADDNKEMQKAIVDLLEPQFDVVAAVTDGRALVEAVERLNPDVALVDISMPILNGIDAVTQITARNSHVSVVFLTVNEDRDFVRAALKAGGLGYVVKRQMATDTIPAIMAVLDGRTFISEGCDF